MSLEEAKNVMWLHSNHKPIGTLMEEGFMTRDKLEWAAAKAWDPRLKEAAAVILAASGESTDKQQQSKSITASQVDTSPPPIDVYMKLSQAEQTIWPLPPFKGQSIGPLVQSRKLTLKDLGWAIENAWEKRVRQAATVLMLNRLSQAINEPDDRVTYTQTITGGTSYAQWKQIQLSTIKGMIAGAICAVILFYAVWIAIRFITHQYALIIPANKNQAIGLAIATVIAVIASLIVWKIFDFFNDATLVKLDRAIQNYNKGQQGEDKVADIITQTLDGTWILFRNITIPGNDKADIDMILLGPPGIWALEVKNLEGEYRNIGEHWEYRIGEKKELMKKSPSIQAQSNARKLRNFLRADKINEYVQPVVVWANQEHTPVIENPTVPIWLYESLPEELGNIWQKDKIPQAEITTIKEKLTKLCTPDRQNAKS